MVHHLNYGVWCTILKKEGAPWKSTHRHLLLVFKIGVRWGWRQVTGPDGQQVSSNDDEGVGGELGGSEQAEDESDAFPPSLDANPKKTWRSLSKDQIEKRSQEKEEKRDRYAATGVAVAAAGGEEPRLGFRFEGKMWNQFNAFVTNLFNHK